MQIIQVVIKVDDEDEQDTGAPERPPARQTRTRQQSRVSGTCTGTAAQRRRQSHHISSNRKQSNIDDQV